MTYVPHTERETREMLAAIGVARLEDLFADVPAAVRFPALKLPPPSSEMEIAADMQALARRNFDVDPSLSFLGAGAYHHFRPATVDYVLRRGEFYTSYTQYQPEASQGMLQALFEYQSMICRLTGMEVSNASHYDGATALAEAVVLALNVAQGKRRKIIMSPAVHPQHREVVRTYLRGTHADSVTGDEDGRSDRDVGPRRRRHLARRNARRRDFFECNPALGAGSCGGFPAPVPSTRPRWRARGPDDRPLRFAGTFADHHRRGPPRLAGKTLDGQERIHRRTARFLLRPAHPARREH